MTPGSTGTLIGQTLGGYRLTGLLGAGGMAEVYRAEDVKLGREVAVKVLPAMLATDAGYVERFRNEARQVAALNHPNVVPVYHYDEEQGLLYLVMPVLTESLRERMDREGPLPASEAGRIVVQIAAALDAAHAIGLVHRDVKPENILINGEGKALLTDFGIAREMSFLRESGTARTLAATGLPVGTPEYMAPEQLRASNVDQRADIYALGAVLYELLTGSVPHGAPTPYEVAALVLTAPLKPPSQLNPAIWPQLDRVVMTALEKNPDDRYQDTRSFALALRKAVLERDASVHRYTMPVGAFDGTTLTALRAAARASETRTPEAAQETAPTVPASGWHAPARRPTWRERLQGKPASARRTLLVGSVIALLLIGVCGGSGVALLSRFSAPIVANGIQSPFGSATDTSVSQTPSSTGTTGSGGTTVHNSATATAGAMATATSTAEGTPAATPTVAPTDTTGPGTPTPTALPSPTPTLTPIPPNLSFSPTTIVMKPTNTNSTVCSGQQTISNNSSHTITWQWQKMTPGPNGGLAYNIPAVNGNKFSGGMPKQTGLPPGDSSVLTVNMNCTPQTSFTVMVTDSLGDGYTIYLQISH